MAMRKVEEAIHESFAPVKLYREDLEELWEVLKGEGRQVTVSNEEWEADDLEELIAGKRSLKQLRFRSIRRRTDPISITDISLTLAPNSCRLRASGVNNEARGICVRIKHIMDRAAQPLRWLTHQVLAPCLFLFGPVFLTAMLTRSEQVLTNVTCVVLPLFFLWIYVSSRLSSHHWCVIVLTRRHESPGFWKGNWEKIAVNVVSGFCGAILSAIVVAPISYYIGHAVGKRDAVSPAAITSPVTTSPSTRP